MPLCIAVTRAGTACNYNAKEGSDKCGVHRAWLPPLGRCEAIMAAGSQCTNKRNHADSTTCWMHRNATRTIQVAAPTIVVQTCTHTGMYGAACGKEVKQANAHNECTMHHRMRKQREASQRRVALYRRVLGVYRDQRMAAGFGDADQNAQNALVNEYRDVAMVAFRTILHANRDAVDVTDEAVRASAAANPVRADDVVIAQWLQRQALWNGRAAAAAAPAGSLASISASTQNIHAPAVVEQAKRGMDFLLAVSVPAGGQDAVLDDLRALWPAARMTSLHADIRTWWNKESCFTTGDWMYRRMLTGLWFYVKSQEDAERRTELEKRLLEECREAMRMCCQGHTNRLVNVLGGFVEGIDVQQSKGQILQERFAVIGNIEDEEQRYIQATQVLAELGVGGEEAGAWLDAIATA